MYFHSTDKKPSKCTLQGFCDASSAAYAAVIYLKVETENGCVVEFRSIVDTGTFEEAD